MANYEFSDYDWLRIIGGSEWEGDCLLWKRGKTQAGYGMMNYKRRCYTVHSLMLRNKLGRDLAPGMDAAHSCNVRNCINPDHLSEKTHRDNLYDKVAAGTWGRKLTDAQATTIRTSTKTLKELAQEFGVSIVAIWKIRRGRSWKHVSPTETGISDS